MGGTGGSFAFLLVTRDLSLVTALKTFQPQTFSCLTSALCPLSLKPSAVDLSPKIFSHSSLVTCHLSLFFLFCRQPSALRRLLSVLRSPWHADLSHHSPDYVEGAAAEAILAKAAVLRRLSSVYRPLPSSSPSSLPYSSRPGRITLFSTARFPPCLFQSCCFRP